jgi:hypothetical protein
MPYGKLFDKNQLHAEFHTGLLQNKPSGEFGRAICECLVQIPSTANKRKAFNYKYL